MEKQRIRTGLFVLRREGKMLTALFPDSDSHRLHGSKEIKELLQSFHLRWKENLLLTPQDRAEAKVNGKAILETVPLSSGSILEIADSKIIYLQGETTEDERVSVRFGRMVSAEPEMVNLFYNASLSTQTDIPIHLSGETGTGKELLAQAIHQASGRKMFLPINCPALPSELIESELFGHSRGAFTGASERKEGAFLAASHGTLLLDEISEIPTSIQAKLLRVVETGEVRRIGGMRTEQSHARLITASNRDLYLEMLGGNFREDLFYRLSCLTLKIPPLRDRISDLELITSDILKEYGNGHQYQLSPEALDKLKSHSWPGNIRELRNCLTRAMLNCSGRVIGAGDVQFNVSVSESRLNNQTAPKESHPELTGDLLYIIGEILKRAGKNGQNGKTFGIPRSTFYSNIYPRLRRVGVM